MGSLEVTVGQVTKPHGDDLKVSFTGPTANAKTGRSSQDSGGFPTWNASFVVPVTPEASFC